MPARPRLPPAVGQGVLVLELAGPEDGVVVAVHDEGRSVEVETAAGVSRFVLRAASGLYVDDRHTRLAFSPPGG
jgi:hypothetical protein